MNRRTTTLKPEDIAPGTCVTGRIKGQDVTIWNIDGQFYATQANCTHRGGPLCEGSLSGDIITCPWHGSQFNARTGEVVMDPATEPLQTFQVMVKDGELVVG